MTLTPKQKKLQDLEVLEWERLEKKYLEWKRLEESYLEWRRPELLGFDPLCVEKRAYQAGRPGSIEAALIQCHSKHIPPPEWICDAVGKLERDKIFSERWNGRTGNYMAEQRQRRIHFVRWAAVFHLRENCSNGKLSWEKAYIAASRELQGTIAQGSARGMKLSYQLALHDPWICELDRTTMQDEARRVYEYKDSLLKKLDSFFTRIK
jgi:hypothetical protein